MACILFLYSGSNCEGFFGLTPENNETKMQFKILHLILAKHFISMPPDVMTLRYACFMVLSVSKEEVRNLAFETCHLHSSPGISVGDSTFGLEILRIFQPDAALKAPSFHWY